MSRTTTNLLGILIAIVAGTYFFAAYCGPCTERPPYDFPLEGANESVKSLESVTFPKDEARLKSNGEDSILTSNSSVKMHRTLNIELNQL